MGRRLAVAVVLTMLTGATAGAAAAVVIDSHPQRLTQSDHEVAAGEAFSVDERTTVYAGADVAGFDVVVRNAGSTDLTVTVTARLLALDGTVVASASESVTVLTGGTATASVRFDAPVGTATYDRLHVEASKG